MPLQVQQQLADLTSQLFSGQKIIIHPQLEAQRAQLFQVKVSDEDMMELRSLSCWGNGTCRTNVVELGHTAGFLAGSDGQVERLLKGMSLARLVKVFRLNAQRHAVAMLQGMNIELVDTLAPCPQRDDLARGRHLPLKLIATGTDDQVPRRAIALVAHGELQA